MYVGGGVSACAFLSFKLQQTWLSLGEMKFSYGWWERKVLFIIHFCFWKMHIYYEQKYVTLKKKQPNIQKLHIHFKQK